MTYCGTDHKGVLFTLIVACFMFYSAKRTSFIFPCNLVFSTAGKLHVEHACCVFGQCCMRGEQRETNGGQCVAADTDIVAHLHKSMFWKYCLHTISFNFLFFSIAIDDTRRECFFLRKRQLTKPDIKLINLYFQVKLSYSKWLKESQLCQK